MRSLGTHSQYSSSEHAILHNTSSPENQLLARKWLYQCLSSHEDCIANIQSVPHIPARLVEISGSDANPILRIIETASRPRDGEYMTLSHCWGSADFLTLRKNCVNSMKEGIVWSSLPKTFQDAVNVTMWFKIKYLWIDSLCIIQDSHEDWERESKQMKQIYKNSFLTITATMAVDATRGLFVDRNPDVVQMSKVHAHWSRELKGDYLFVYWALWADEIIGSPLLKRAWVCQERLLSRRILHFGRSQLFWECQDLEACETFPKSLPPTKIHEASVNLSKRRLLFNGENSHKESWGSIVNQYSNGNLTNMSDKCIAFAGIVEEFQAFAQSEYLAGFWRHNLEQQLLWCKDHLTRTVRPQSYIAPSWSWLSIDGGVFPNHSLEGKPLLEILDVSVSYSSDNILGPIKHGYISARGILGPAVWERRDQSPWDWTLRSIRGCRPSSVPRPVTVFMDEMEDRISGNAVYLPVIDNLHMLDGGPSFIKGLLLVPTGEAQNEYRRIGMFSTSGTSSEVHRSLLLETRTARGVWRSLPRRTFTIV